MELDSEIESKEEDNYLVERNILLRNYQIKLVEQAKDHNSIIYLPTGAGKTLIAIHVLCSKTCEINRPFSDGGKRAFFITTTKVMVAQITKVIKTHTKFTTVSLTGDMNVDHWSGSHWKNLFEKKQVFILTGEILKVILHLNFISPSQISLVVLDECHHALYSHPYRLVVKALTAESSAEAPLILGLSSILLNGSPKTKNIEQSIKFLERSLNAKVITETQFTEVMSFSANPVDKLMVYKKDSIDSTTEFILQEYDRIIDTISNLILKSPKDPVIPETGRDFKERNKAKRIKNCFVTSKNLFEELGMFGGSLCALFHLITFEKMRLMSLDEVEIHTLLYANTEILKLRRIFSNCMGEEETVDSIINFSSDKVRRLIYIIKEAHDASKGKHLSILVFVKERVTAVILTFLLKRLKEVGREFSFLKCEFVIGTSCFSRESMFLECKNEEIIRKFASRSLNVLVATNLLEEGVDISACNIVISFDFPLGYPSYFQSRGRARNNDSTYIMFTEEKEVYKRRASVDFFRSIENEIFRVVSQESRLSSFESDDDSNDIPEKIYLTGKFGKISIDGPIAIKAVDRYCRKLPSDRDSSLGPTSWYIREGLMKKAFVRLPLNCPLREIIEGEWRVSRRSAKGSAFLYTVKKLYEMAELDDDLNPRSSENTLEDFSYLFPHYEDEKIDNSLPQPGTSKREQKYKRKFSESLANCLPRPGVKAYLHVINFTVTFNKPPLERKVVIYETLLYPATFAMLSSKKLWKIIEFPLFLDMGQIKCDLLVNYEELVLTESDLNGIKEFHFALFKKVTNVLKNSQVFDNRNKENSFFLVPVEKNNEGRFALNWDLIRCDYCRKDTSALVRYHPPSGRRMTKVIKVIPKETPADSSSNALVPSNRINGRMLWGISEGENQAKFVMTETDYKYFVITPNYRNQAFPQQYIVNKFCVDMSPLSPFPKIIYGDYVTYYKSNYSVDITNLTQPLLRVSPIYGCSNFNRPSRRNLKRERHTNYEEHLVPELCDVIPFDRRYFLKALLLPTALNRICHIYSVEEFRRRIASETGLGVCQLPEGEKWPPLSVIHSGEDEENEDGVGSYSLKNITPALPLTKLKDKTQVKEQIILDPERHMYEVGLCDLEFYVKHLQGFNEMTGLNEDDESLHPSVVRNISIPSLSTLKGGNSPTGPDLAQLIQASTARSANDAIDFERLEILGDALLKFVTIVFLFKKFNKNESVLTLVKGKIVGNRNLLYCGLAKGFPDVINVNEFVPASDWNPPLFCIPERLAEGIVSGNKDLAVIYRFDIPVEEQFSGVLSEETFQKNEEILERYEKCYEMASSSLLQYKVIKDKSISDCIEAYTGAYLLALGIRGAFHFLQWLDILPRSDISYSELFEQTYHTPSEQGDEAAVKSLLSSVFHSDLEAVLNYRFNNRFLLLEAITHPSYSRNQVTDCYQRLELLGDTVLDFLITSYIYEHCGSLSPGEVTDIRSSLVNNITFACLTVRYGLHKYLLSFSSDLNTAISNFVTFQESRNHVVDDNVVILMEENDYTLAESVRVPKALGDIFESLAGAIYLDSGNSLETVWNVFYVLMKREIDEFVKTVPKTPARLLNEICGDKPYCESKVVKNGLVMVTCVIYYEGEEIKSYGFGDNKKEAKRSAFKVAINKILSLKK